MQYRLSRVLHWYQRRRLRYIPTKTPAGGITARPKIKLSGAFAAKPIKVKIGGSFSEKQLKVKVGGTFVNV